jgi:hypothetical protein
MGQVMESGGFIVQLQDLIMFSRMRDPYLFTNVIYDAANNSGYTRTTSSAAVKKR